MYWKEKDSAGIRVHRIHEGNGNIETRGFFDGISKLPIRFQKWELGPRVS